MGKSEVSNAPGEAIDYLDTDMIDEGNGGDTDTDADETTEEEAYDRRVVMTTHISKPQGHHRLANGIRYLIAIMALTGILTAKQPDFEPKDLKPTRRTKRNPDGTTSPKPPQVALGVKVERAGSSIDAIEGYDDARDTIENPLDNAGVEPLCNAKPLDETGAAWAVEGYCFDVFNWAPNQLLTVGEMDPGTGEILNKGRVSGTLTSLGSTLLEGGPLTMMLSNKALEANEEINVNEEIRVEAENSVSVFTADTVYAELIYKNTDQGIAPFLKVFAQYGDAKVVSKGRTIYIPGGQGREIPLFFKEDDAILPGINCNVVVLSSSAKTKCDDSRPLSIIITGSALFALVARRKREDDDAPLAS